MMDSMSKPSAVHRAVILKAMDDQVKKLYHEPTTRYKLSLLSRLDNQNSQKIREDLSLVDQVIESIVRNSANGNLKRAFHFLIVLEQLIKRIQSQVHSLNFIGLLVK